MAATITDKIMKPSTGSRPNPTTLTAPKGIGDSILNSDDLTGWGTTTAIPFVLYKVDTNGNELINTRTDWKGIVSGNTITQLTLTAGVDTIYPAGSAVVATPTARYGDDLSDALLTSLNQNGTIKDNAVTNTTIATNAVDASKLATGAIKLGYSQITSSFVSSGADNTLLDVTGLSSTVTVPNGGRDVEVIVKLGSMKTDAGAGTVLTLAVVEGSTVLDAIVWNEPVAAFNLPIYWAARVSAPSIGSHTYKIQFAKAAGNVTIGASGSPGAGTPGPAYILVKSL